MKNRTLIAALIVTFVSGTLLPSCNKPTSSASKTPTTAAPKDVKSGKIVFVDIDTVFKHYDLAKELNTSMEAKQKQLDAELNGKTKSFQSSVLDFQNKVQKGLITQANAQEMQQQLSSQEQSLYQLRDQYRGQLSEEASVNQRRIYQSIMDFLKDYNKNKGYEYILANTFPSTILFAEPTLNITKEVVEGINIKYKTEKTKETPVKK